MPRQTYTMTEEQYEAILDACKPVPYIIVGGIPPRSQQENANDAWERLGKEMGFKFMTVQPGNSKLEFTAEPMENQDET